MVERIDKDWWQSKYLLFRDDGPLKQGAKTRQFSVLSRRTKALLGHSKWWTNWRQYCFFPLNSLFDKKCLREIADFCETVTEEHNSNLPGMERLRKQRMLARRENRIKKLKNLTEQKNSDIMIIESEKI